MTEPLPEVHSALGQMFAKSGGHMPLFATPKEMEGIHYGDAFLGHETIAAYKEKLMSEKLNNASRPFSENEFGESSMGLDGGLRDSIHEHGYDWKKPVELDPIGDDHSGMTLRDGHHRFAVMRKDRPDEWMPVAPHGGWAWQKRYE